MYSAIMLRHEILHCIRVLLERHAALAVSACAIMPDKFFDSGNEIELIYGFFLK